MDLEQGWCYVFDSVSYPRYRYFQQRSHDLLPRWQRIMDCVSHGRDKIKKISQSVEQLGSEISISVFGDNNQLRRSETDLPVHTKTSYRKRTSVTLESHLRSLKAQTNDEGLAPVITVILVTSLSYDITMKSLSSKLSGLSKQQFESFIISVTDSNTTYIYSALLNQNTDIEKAKSSAKEVKGLGKQIQYVLEKKAVTILEQIVDFLKAFSLSARGDPPNMSLANTIFAQLKKSLENRFVVKDIAPYPKEGVELKQRTDKRPVEMTKKDKDKKFQKNLLEFVAKRSKCSLIDELSRQYGISASLINEFLNDRSFRYEKKVEKVAHDVELPSWPEDTKDCGASTCSSFADSLSCKLEPLLNDVENYIKRKHWMLVLVKRLQFELFGLLEQTVVPTTVYTPDIPKLPKNMQKDLLELPDVYGCGTIWGELVVHFLTPVSVSAKKEIKSILSRYSYRHPYTSQLVEPCREQGGGKQVKQGTSIRVKKRTDGTQPADTGTSSEDDGYAYSTLGCFVQIKPSATTAENVSAEDSGKLYAVTCAHCLKDFDPKVEASIYTTLGRKAYDLYEPEAIDIAVVEVADDALSICETALKDSNGELVSTWQFYEGPLSTGLSVYKRGSASGLTRGLCMCLDYQFKTIYKLNEKLKKQKLPLLDPEYNILISPSPDNRGSTAVVAPGTQDQEMSKGYFSVSGDSGSVVCADVPSTKNVQVVSLLQGALWVPAENEPYSYSSSMLKTVKKLEETKSWTITPASD